MTPFELHETAMNYSFRAREARYNGNEDEALLFYEEAAKAETEAAKHYFEKTELEPTRSILIRSAAFLNLKAGRLKEAEEFIFFGLVNIKDESIVDQLYDALELSTTYRKLSPKQISGNVDYIYRLRQKSILYVLEPKSPQYSNAATLEMVTDFSENYIKSLKAYSKSEFKSRFAAKFDNTDKEETAAREMQKLINPIISNAGFGSFKFSIAVDFLPRIGETEDFVKFKSNILLNYHDYVFISDFSQEQIEKYKNRFRAKEIDEIFRPIFNMRSTRASYHIGYFDREEIKKRFISATKSNQRKDLLPMRELSVADIGFLENTIIHTHEVDGATSRRVLLKRQLKSSEFDFPTNLIEPKGFSSIILNQEIIVSVKFDTETGFRFVYDDLGIEVSSTNFAEAKNMFYNEFLAVARSILEKPQSEITDNELRYLSVLQRLINNPSELLG